MPIISKLPGNKIRSILFHISNKSTSDTNTKTNSNESKESTTEK